MVHNLLLIGTGWGSSTPPSFSIRSGEPTFSQPQRAEMHINKATDRRDELFTMQWAPAPCAVAWTSETERRDRHAFGGFPLWRAGKHRFRTSCQELHPSDHKCWGLPWFSGCSLVLGSWQDQSTDFHEVIAVWHAAGLKNGAKQNSPLLKAVRNRREEYFWLYECGALTGELAGFAGL